MTYSPPVPLSAPARLSRSSAASTFATVGASPSVRAKSSKVSPDFSIDACNHAATNRIDNGDTYAVAPSPAVSVFDRKIKVVPGLSGEAQGLRFPHHPAPNSATIIKDETSLMIVPKINPRSEERRVGKECR